MAARAVTELRDGDYVNLEVTLHAENGIIGVGPSSTTTKWSLTWAQRASRSWRWSRVPRTSTPLRVSR
jgi:acyl CoA:acetate/3-ketoacid CoA transferase beta subunit